MPAFITYFTPRSRLNLKDPSPRATSFWFFAAAADYSDNGIGHRLLILVEHPSGDCDVYVGKFKTENMVIASRAATVGTEIAGLARPNVIPKSSPALLTGCPMFSTLQYSPVVLSLALKMSVLRIRGVRCSQNRAESQCENKGTTHCGCVDLRPMFSRGSTRSFRFTLHMSSPPYPPGISRRNRGICRRPTPQGVLPPRVCRL